MYTSKNYYDRLWFNTSVIYYYLGGEFMRKNIFPIFITGLGIFTAYVFYALWHTDEVNPSQANNQSINTETTPKHFTPKKRITSTALNTEDIKISPIIDDKDTNKNNTPQLTQQEMQDKTEEVYASLTPDSYEEVQQQAELAFEAIDEYAQSIDTQTMLEEEIIQEVMANR